MDCIMYFILFILVTIAMFILIYIAKQKEHVNRVHFYVARDKSDILYLHIGKPYRNGIEFSNDIGMYYRLRSNNFTYFGLNEKDYANLKWEDEPVEVFINMED